MFNENLNIKTVTDLAKKKIAGKNVLLRLDLNLPRNGHTFDLTRFERAMPTLELLSSVGAKTYVISHFGRPDGVDPDMSLKEVFSTLQSNLTKKLKSRVIFHDNCVEHIDIKNSDVCFMENTRFHDGEKKNLKTFAAQLANKKDYFVNDAFSCCHLEHASTLGVTELLPSYAGLGLIKEIKSLAKILSNPSKPLMAIVGGSKISTKLPLLNSLVSKCDILMVAGAMANTFLHANGVNIGKSLYEDSCIGEAKSIMKKASQNNCELILPVDAIVVKDLSESGRVADIDDIGPSEKITDIGSRTLHKFCNMLNGTLLWNGPFGMFEYRVFAQGTLRFALSVGEKTAEGNLISLAGGGDTLSALNETGVVNQLTYVSSGGGAFLALLSDQKMPAIEKLLNK